MTPLTGYLVVCETVTQVSPLNPAYRGIDRRPMWSQELFDSGFDDPYVFGDYVDEHGLIPTLELAREVLQKLAAVLPDKLEIIQVLEVVDADAPSALTPSSFGLDVALREFSFESQLDDYPNHDESQTFLPLLNRHGLFESAKDAHRFRELCLRIPNPHLHSNDVLVVWRVDSIA